MANSKCIKCDSTRFELKQANISGASFILFFVQCASCGGVVGVVEASNIGAKIDGLAKKLGVR